MKNINYKRIIISTSLPLILLACTNTVPAKFTGADMVRARFSQLESNSELAYQAPMAMKEARAAVLLAEQRQKNPADSEHLIFIAERKVDIAEAESMRHLLEQQRDQLNSRRDPMQLIARTNESRMARTAARQAEQQTALAQEQARRAQADTASAQQSLSQAERDTVAAKSQLTDMQLQLKELDARQDTRGTVITLGDVLFDFSKAEINPAALSHLAKLASFLNNNENRHATIEGHTDNTGAAEFNLQLSQQRADAVRNYLQSQGVAESRLDTIGKGAEFPVTDNSTMQKRQQNRRVEVIIGEPVS